MSAYEDYSRKAPSYDATRSALGVEVIVGCLAHSGMELDRLTLLDAGCGTGNYARALLAHVARVLCVDLNADMLARARAKLCTAAVAGRAHFARANLTALPLADASVDGAMVNQVLHHLPDSREQGWPLRRRVLQELARVIRVGGVLTINTCLPAQIRQSWWYLDLVPRAVDSMCARHLQLEELCALLAPLGFEIRGRIVPVDALIQGEHYFDTEGPGRAEWRDGDSLWADVTDAELAAALAALAELHRSGDIERYLCEHDRRRQELGQVTFVHAVRCAA